MKRLQYIDSKGSKANIPQAFKIEIKISFRRPALEISNKAYSCDSFVHWVGTVCWDRCARKEVDSVDWVPWFLLQYAEWHSGCLSEGIYLLDSHVKLHTMNFTNIVPSWMVLLGTAVLFLYNHIGKNRNKSTDAGSK